MDARALDRVAELAARGERTVGASIAVAGAVPALRGDRSERALATLRARWRREGVTDSAEPVRVLRIQVREFGLERTIEEWTRHTIGPPSIRV